MNEKAHSSVDARLLSAWLERARAGATKCFICMRIAEGNPEQGAELRPIRISGIELSPETQSSHLARCIGATRPNA